MKAFTSLASRICMPSATTSLMSTTRAFGTKALKPPVRVAVTGAAGQIGYALIFRIASGQLLGPDQPVILHLLELPHALNSLKGVVMELNDCAFPLVQGIVPTEDLATGFKDVNYALLVGAKPRGKGMERKDLLKDNAAIFSAQGKAINSHASRDIKVLVVGNPANTNALIAAKNAPTIPPTQFSAMTRLDHNRGLAQLSEKLNTPVTSIQKFAIWGNHSATQYPDVSHTLVNGKSAKQLINDEKWIRDTFIPTVQQRGAAIINARGSSSAASAASAAIDHIRDWALGKGDKDWTSMAVWSESNYGIQPELYFSYPVTLEGNGKYKVVQGVTHDEYSQQKIKATEKELLEERDAVKEYFK